MDIDDPASTDQFFLRGLRLLIKQEMEKEDLDLGLIAKLADEIVDLQKKIIEENPVHWEESMK